MRVEPPSVQTSSYATATCMYTTDISDGKGRGKVKIQSQVQNLKEGTKRGSELELATWTGAYSEVYSKPEKEEKEEKEEKGEEIVIHTVV